MNDIIYRLEQNNKALERIAFLYDGAIIEDLKEGIIESTSASTTCLIEIRNNKRMTEKIKSGTLKDAS